MQGFFARQPRGINSLAPAKMLHPAQPILSPAFCLIHKVPSKHPSSGISHSSMGDLQQVHWDGFRCLIAQTSPTWFSLTQFRMADPCQIGVKRRLFVFGLPTRTCIFKFWISYLIQCYVFKNHNSALVASVSSTSSNNHHNSA